MLKQEEHEKAGENGNDQPKDIFDRTIFCQACRRAEPPSHPASPII
jgi:hypothetical protein